MFKQVAYHLLLREYQPALRCCLVYWDTKHRKFALTDKVAHQRNALLLIIGKLCDFLAQFVYHGLVESADIYLVLILGRDTIQKIGLVLSDDIGYAPAFKQLYQLFFALVQFSGTVRNENRTVRLAKHL